MNFRGLKIYLIFSVAEANDKIKVLEHKLFTLDEPYFDEDENLKDFSSIHKYGKQIAKYIQDEEELDSEISELNDYVSDPKSIYVTRNW